MPRTPVVSVVTATHNGEQFLPATFHSIRQQTLEDFEYILVDDGSTDGTPALLGKFLAEDGRVVVLRTPSNLGPAGALNFGWRAARGEFVAILDHDDMAMADRLAKQVTFLQQQPSIGVVGSFYSYVNEHGKRIDNPEFSPEHEAQAPRIVPTTSAGVQWTLYFHGALLHSAMTLRKEVLEQAGGYSPRHRYACDLELTQRLAGRIQMVNLPEVLACYRLHGGQVSQRLRKIQIGEVLLSLQRMWFDLLGERVSLNGVATVYEARAGIQVDDEASLRMGGELLLQIYRRFVARLSANEAVGEEAWDWIRQDCAFRLYLLGYIHRSRFPAVYQELWQQSKELDLLVAEHPTNRQRLQRLDNRISAQIAGSSSVP